MFNLLDDVISTEIWEEPWHHRVAKRLKRSLTNAELVERSTRHYTIFPHELLAPVWKNPVEVALFEEKPGPRTPERGLVTVLLGTFPGGFGRRTPQSAIDQYLNLRSQWRADLVLPHPADRSPPQVSDSLRKNRPLMELIGTAIAEEIVMTLRRQGYEVDVYGFSSTALANLAPYVRTYNVVIPGFSVISVSLFERLGVTTLTPSDILHRAQLHLRPPIHEADSSALRNNLGQIKQRPAR